MGVYRTISEARKIAEVLYPGRMKTEIVEAILTRIYEVFYDTEDDNSSMGIGYDENGLPNRVSLEMYGRTHSEFTLPPQD